MMQGCPCKSGKSYKLCCQPYHQGKRPLTPTLLMRSRFAAYALGKVGYIIQTERLEAPSRREELRRFCEQTDFLGLQIMDADEIGDDSATVTFHAVLLQDGRDASFTERSLFKRERGRWVYISALSLEAKK